MQLSLWTDGPREESVARLHPGLAVRPFANGNHSNHWTICWCTAEAVFFLIDAATRGATGEQTCHLTCGCGIVSACHASSPHPELLPGRLDVRVRR